MTKVFIDGKQGTTGLRIYDRLEKRDDITLITLPEEHRKDSEYRKKAINESDIAFLCLPDAAAIDAVNMIENDNTVIIDTSTAHRTDDGWAYGFPELSSVHLEKIKNSKRIAVPGCYAGGFISLVAPLVENKIISPDTNLICHAVSGYSGAGNKGIAQYEDKDRSILLSAPRQYALTQQHKHLKEMKIISKLSKEPIFCPYICDFYSGMEVTVPLFKSDLLSGKTIDDIKEVYKNLYNSDIVKFCESIDEEGFISANALKDLDSMQITVCGNDERILLISRFNNLGKGASGAAVQCMNIVLGKDMNTGLDL